MFDCMSCKEKEVPDAISSECARCRQEKCLECMDENGACIECFLPYEMF